MNRTIITCHRCGHLCVCPRFLDSYRGIPGSIGFLCVELNRETAGFPRGCPNREDHSAFDRRITARVFGRRSLDRQKENENGEA